MKRRRGAFTLFELILAIALSAVLLALIGTAINLYLVRVDASRTRVEEAQLARSILAMIADDLRATAVYDPQDLSAMAGLMANGTPFDVDSIDEPRTGETGDASGTSTSTLSTSGSTSGPGGSTSSSTGSSETSGSSTEVEDSMPVGLSGTLAELYIDVARLPRQDALFGTVTGYTNAPLPTPAGALAPGATGAAAAGIKRPSDLNTVRYFVREGERLDSSGLAATSLAPHLQLSAGGLVRQEISRPTRVFAEQLGNSALLDSGQVLVAPEVVHLEFRYYDGQQITDVWDMLEEKSLPRAIKIKIWLASADASDSIGTSSYDVADFANNAREYRQTIYLPMSELSPAGAAGGMSGSSSSSSSSFGSSTSGSESSSSTSSGFGQPQ